MLEEGLLERDHVTLNTTIYCVTKQMQINNQSRRQSCYINYRASREKTTQPTENNKR